MTDPAVAAPAASESDTSWAASAAHSAFEFKVGQWAEDMKAAISHAKPPHVSETAINLSNLVYFNMAVDGAKAWFPKTAGAVLSRFAGPIAILNAASTAFESAYKAHAQAVNAKLSSKYDNARNDFRDHVNKAADNFMDAGTAGRELWIHLTRLLERRETIGRLSADANWSDANYREQLASDFAKDIIRKAEIFPSNAALSKWAENSFEEMLRRLKAVYLHHKGGMTGGPARGHVYVVDDHGVRDFPTLGEAGQVCLNENYSWTRILTAFGVPDCYQEVAGRRISSAKDFHFLLRNGWLFKIEPKTVPQQYGNAILNVQHLAIIPLKGATRGLKPNITATRDALDWGYQTVMRQA